MENKDNLLGVIATIFKWKKQILTIVLIATLGTALISFLVLKNYFQSTTTFYVASPDIFKPEQMFGNSTKDMDFYGTANDLDRVMTIAESGELYDFLIKKFDLNRHYDIDTTDEKAPFKVREKLEKLYNVKKTKFDAIELSVEDTDRKLATEMANAAREKVDEISQRLIRQSQENLMKAYEQSSIEKEKVLAGIGDTLQKLRQNFGVIDPEKQTEAVTKTAVESEANYARSKAKFESLRKMPNVSQDTLSQLESSVKGYEEEMKSNNNMLKKYNQGFNSVSALKEFYERERDQIGRDRQRALQLRIAYNTKISALIIVENAKVPIVKSRPKRTVIILSAALIALIFSVLAVLLIDNYKDVNWNELTHPTK
jgi:tyrosine-protein kinase Etk/Wzc